MNNEYPSFDLTGQIALVTGAARGLGHDISLALAHAGAAAAKVMMKQKYGRIINLSSQAGFAALPTESIYCMTKAGLSHLTKCLAVEWGQYNITVNAVAPTFIYTPGTEEALADPTFKADVLSRIALGRIGDPAEVGAAVVYLASPAAGLVTGHTLPIAGGWTAR